MKKELSNKFENIYENLEQLKTNDNTILMNKVWEMIRDLEHLIDKNESIQRQEIQKKLNEISLIVS